MIKNYILVSLLLIFPALIRAQWQQTNGPQPKVSITCFGFCGSSVYAGADNHWWYQEEYRGGIYKTNDNGVNWQEEKNGLPDAFTEVTAIVSKGTDVFAAIPGYGIFKKSDLVDNWIPINNGISDSNIRAMAVKGSYLFAVYYSGVYRSDDDGAHWTEMNSGLPTSGAYFQTIVATATTVVIGGTNTLYKSSDNGVTWSISPGQEGWLATNGSAIYALLSNGLSRSFDNGNSWTFKKFGFESEIGFSCIAAEGSSIIIGTASNPAGIFKSTDYGESWMAINNGIPAYTFYCNAIAINGSRYYAGGWEGVYLSENNGNLWSGINNGLPAKTVSAIVTRWTSVFAGTDGGGVFHSTDIGSNWSRTSAGMDEFNVQALAIKGTELFAGTDNGLFISNTFGEFWTISTTGLLNNDICSFLVSGANVYTGTEGGGIFLSDDGGLSWNAKNTGLTNLNIRALAQTGSAIFCGTHGGGVFRSTDEGNTWSIANSGLTNLNINVLAGNVNSVFAGTENGMFFSSDEGATWEAVNNGLTNTFINAIVLSGQELFTGTNNGIFLSSDEGQNWIRINEGLPDTVINSLAVSSSDLFAGILSKQVWTRPLSDFFILSIYPDYLILEETQDSYGTIKIFANSQWVLQGILPSWLDVNKWTGAGNDSLIFHTTQANQSLYQQSAAFEIISSTQSSQGFTVIQKQKTAGFTETVSERIHIYPNPAEDHITIDLPFSFFKGTLSILSTSGQELKAFRLTEPHSCLDVENLHPGLYLIRFTGETYTLSGKFVKSE